MNFKTIILLLFPLLFGTQLQSQTLTIPLNNDSSEGLGYYQEIDHKGWAPLSFFIDSQNNIVIPDFYKGRAVLYHWNQGYLSAIALEGLSPNLSLWASDDQDNIYYFQNQALHCRNDQGEYLWSTDLPLGTQPRELRFHGDYFFALINRSQPSLVFSNQAGQILGQFGRDNHPLFQEQDRSQAFYSQDLTLIDQAIPPALEGQNRRYHSSSSGDGALWFQVNRNEVDFLLLSPEGQVLGQWQGQISGGTEQTTAWSFMWQSEEDGKGWFITMNRFPEYIEMRREMVGFFENSSLGGQP